MGLLIDAQHHGMVRRVDVQADNVANLLNHQRVGRQLEGLAMVKTQPEGPPDATDGHATEAHRPCKRAGAPVRSAGRGRLQRGDDALFDLVVGHTVRGVPGRGSSRHRGVARVARPLLEAIGVLRGDGHSAPDRLPAAEHEVEPVAARPVRSAPLGDGGAVPAGCGRHPRRRESTATSSGYLRSGVTVPARRRRRSVYRGKQTVG